MKIKIGKEELQRAVDIAFRAVPTKTAMPVLQGLYFQCKDDGEINITGYDMVKGLRSTIKADKVKIADGGNAIVDAKRLIETLHALPDGDIIFEVNKTEAVITWVSKKERANQIRIPQLGEGFEYPEWPAPGELCGVLEFQPDKLGRLLEACKSAISRDEARPVYNGILFEKEVGDTLNVVATDGFKLAWAQTTTEESDRSFSAIIPSSSITDIQKVCDAEASILPVRLEIYNKHIKLITDSSEVLARRVEGDFIDFRKVVTIGNCCYNTDKAVFMASVFRAKLSDKAGTNPIRITFGDSEAKTVMMTSSGYTEEYFDVEGQNNTDPIEIGLNPEYLINAIKAFSSTKKISINLAGASKPAVLRSNEKDDFDLRYMVLPVRLNRTSL